MSSGSAYLASHPGSPTTSRLSVPGQLHLPARNPYSCLALPEFPRSLSGAPQVGTQSAMKPSRSLSTVGAYSARITDIPRPQEVSSYKPHCPLCENRAVNRTSSARPMVCGDGRLRNISLTGAKLRVRCSVGSAASGLPFYCRSWSDLPRWPAFLPMSWA